MKSNTNRAGSLNFDRISRAYTLGRPDVPAEYLGRLAARFDLDEVGDRGMAVEVGAGTGQLTYWLLGSGRTVTAYEPGPRLANHLAKRFNTQLASGRLKIVREPVATGKEYVGPTATEIWAADAWHWLDPVDAGHWVSGMLRPGGKLILMWGFPAVRDPTIEIELNNFYLERAPGLVRHGANYPGELDESLRQGRTEVLDFSAVSEVGNWLHAEDKDLPASEYVAWQLTYGFFAEWDDDQRKDFCRDLLNSIHTVAPTGLVPWRVWRYAAVFRAEPAR